MSARVVTAGLLVALLPVAAACGGGGHGASPAPHPTSSRSPSASASPPHLDRAGPALKQLTIKACPTTKGKAVATGVIHNDDKAGGDYVITVNWLDSKGSVVASGFDVLHHLGAGKHATYAVDTQLGTAVSGCTTRVARGHL